VAAIGLPIMLQNLFVNTTSMVATMMVGTLGERSMSAVGISGQFSGLFFAGYYGFLSGGVLFFAQFFGAKDEDGIRRAYGLALSCMLVVSVVFAGAAIFAPAMVLGIYTDKQEIINTGAEYLRIIGFSFPLQVIVATIAGLLRSTKRVIVLLVSGVITQLVNLALNWLLIYGHWGFPQMGLRGAALSAVISVAVNVVILYSIAVCQRDTLILRIKAHYRWNAALVRMFFLKSAPIIANEVFYGGGMLMVNMVLGRQEEASIAALTVFRTVERFIFSFYSGLTGASGVIVGSHIGAGELGEGYRAARRLAFLSPTLIFIVCLIILPFRDPLLRLFSLTGTAHAYGMFMILLYMVAGTVRTTTYLINETFRSSGETIFGTALEVGSLFLITLPAIWFAGVYLKLPFIAVFSLLFIEDFVRIFIMFRYLYSGRWVKPVTEQGQTALFQFREDMRKRRTRKA